MNLKFSGAGSVNLPERLENSAGVGWSPRLLGNGVIAAVYQGLESWIADNPGSSAAGTQNRTFALYRWFEGRRADVEI